MRNAFIDELTELAEADERIHLITADLGFTVVERFADRHPGRFLNVGVAEQNMLGIAAGMAQEGCVPFCYSIATFAAMRGYEQLRNGGVLHDLPVRVVGIGGGYAYGHAGPTHFALEDLAIMRAQPGMTVLAPADPAQARAALRASQDVAGPVYFRVGKGGNPELPGLGGRFALGRPEVVREGEDLLFVTTGDMAIEALTAADTLAPEGVSCAVAVMAHLPSRGGPELQSLLSRFGCAVSVEEGYVGGLGSLVALSIAEAGIACRLAARAIDQSLTPRSGSRAWMQAQAGLDASSLVDVARKLVASR
jgi:transketolase